MTLHQLAIFRAAAKYLNLTKAADELHIGQSSVSKQLKLLEKEFALELYRRTGQGIELTEEGRLFLKEAESTLLQVENLRNQFSHRLNGSKSVRLMVGASYGPSVLLLPSVLAAYKKDHPEVQLVLRTARSQAIERMVIQQEVELGVITNSSNLSFLTYIDCRGENLVAFVPVKHPLAKRKNMTLTELARNPLILRRQNLARETRAEQLLRQTLGPNIKPNIAMYCDSPEAMKAAVKRGMGVGISYRDYVEGERSLRIIKIRELENQINRHIIYHKEKLLSPHARNLLTLLPEWPRKHPKIRRS